jgi:hypothetical protein
MGMPKQRRRKRRRRRRTMIRVGFIKMVLFFVHRMGILLSKGPSALPYSNSAILFSLSGYAMDVSIATGIYAWMPPNTKIPLVCPFHRHPNISPFPSKKN